MVLRKTVSREQLLAKSRAWRTTSRRTTSHQWLARTAQTNLESLLLERLLLHLCVLARTHRRKGSLPRLCGERVLLRVIDTLRPIRFGLPTRPLFSTPDEVFAGNTHFYSPNTCENLYKCFVRNPPGGSHRGKSWLLSASVLSSLSYALCALL